MALVKAHGLQYAITKFEPIFVREQNYYTKYNTLYEKYDITRFIQSYFCLYLFTHYVAVYASMVYAVAVF